MNSFPDGGFRHRPRGDHLGTRGARFHQAGLNEPHSVFAFKHAIIQNVAYETLLLKQRKELHGLVAQAIEDLSGGQPEDYCEPLAFHYSRDHDLDRAVRYLELAGDRAARSFALDSARNHFSAAIHLLTERNQRGRRIEISLKWAAASQFATAKSIST